MDSQYKLGLNASGSFVMASIDEDELEHLKTVHFDSIEWRKELHVVEAKGKQKKGTLVTLVNLSPDGRYCRIPGKFRYLSPKMLDAEPETIPDFISRIQDNPTLRVFASKDMKEYVGILVGDRNADYKSLITLVDGNLKALKLEENPPSQSLKDKTRILKDNPEEGEAVRKQLLLLGTT